MTDIASTRHLVFAPPCAFDLQKTVRSHGWINLAPFTWDEATGTLNRAELYESTLVQVSLAQQADGVLRVQVDPGGVVSEHVVRRWVSRMLMLDWDEGPAVKLARTLEPNIADFLAAGGGRFLRGTSIFEDFAKTVCTINTSWRNTIRMTELLVREFGSGAFPSAETIACTQEVEIQARAKVGYRARTLVEGARTLAGHNEKSVAKPGREELMAIPGIGPYAADHMMVLLGNHARIPVDSEVLHYCQRALSMNPTTTAEEIQSHFDPWEEYRFIGYKVGRILRRTNWIG